ncbi:hypothetical protein NESM_000305000 [Novymonas esmeraldas]|uniref:Uncharacterized protein n=1 Tax=Novymonas esmeraldas TaxID=1808958 RepID=A0AAW0FCT5_9TRYP
MEYHRLDLVDQGVESLEGLAERRAENFLVINLQRNRLSNFEAFGTHPHLAELHLQRNQIQSFRGLTKQASLRSLHLHGCPVACHPYYRLMALLTVGLGLEEVDGLPITSHERHTASALGKKAALAVSYGWLLDLHPRSTADYEAIIDEFRRLRKDGHRQVQQRTAAVVTVSTVLANLELTRRQRGVDATVELQLAERQQTITRLARRVEQLERQLTSPPAAHLVPLLPPSDGALGIHGGNGAASSGALFSAAELAQMERMSFSEGIQLRHNLGAAPGVFQRVCLVVDHTTVTAESFLSRERLVQFALQGLRVRHLRPLTLVVEGGAGGGMLELLFDSLPRLYTVYKALFLLSARPVPPLSVVVQHELREMERKPRRLRNAPATTVAPMAAFAASSVEPGASYRPPSEHSAASAASSVLPQAIAVGKATPEPSTVQSAPALDNVADVPPLPAAYSRLSTTGMSASIDFASDANGTARRGAGGGAGSEAAKDTPAPEVLAAPSRAGEGSAAAQGGPALPATQRFGNLLLDSTSSDSFAFHSEAENNSATAVERVAASSSAQDAAPSAPPPSIPPSTSRAAAPAPPRAPPRKAPAPASATAERTETAPPRHPPSPQAASISSRGGASHNPSFAGSVRRGEGAHASSINFQVAASEEGSVRASAARSTAAESTQQQRRPAVPSRFSALLVDSDSD